MRVVEARVAHLIKFKGYYFLIWLFICLFFPAPAASQERSLLLLCVFARACVLRNRRNLRPRFLFSSLPHHSYIHLNT